MKNVVTFGNNNVKIIIDCNKNIICGIFEKYKADFIKLTDKINKDIKSNEI